MNKNEFLNFEEIMKIITELSKSQGFYGRLLRDINALSKSKLESFKQEMEERKFKDSIDLILFFEC